MLMKQFLIKCVLAVCITFCCLFYLDMMYEQKADNPINEINIFNFIPDGIEVANVGSSHGQYGLNWSSLLKEKGIKSFNFALTSQSFEYDYALINMHKDEFADGALLFIPVSYFSFNQEATNPKDVEAISVRYYRLLSPEYNPDYSLYKDLVTVRFPVLSAGEDIVEIFKPPVTFPSLSENRQNTVYAAEEPANISDTSKDSPEAPSAETIYDAETIQTFESKGLARYQRHFEGKEEYFEEDKIQDLENLIELCQRENITPILITMPFTKYYNQYVSEEFMYGFYSTIKDVVDTYGLTYYDYSHDERFQNNLQYFADADHLNDEGAIYFTEMLAEEIPELKAYIENHS